MSHFSKQKAISSVEQFCHVLDDMMELIRCTGVRPIELEEMKHIIQQRETLSLERPLDIKELTNNTTSLINTLNELHRYLTSFQSLMHSTGHHALDRLIEGIYDRSFLVFEFRLTTKAVPHPTAFHLTNKNGEITFRQKILKNLLSLGHIQSVKVKKVEDKKDTQLNLLLETRTGQVCDCVLICQENQNLLKILELF